MSKKRKPSPVSEVLPDRGSNSQTPPSRFEYTLPPRLLDLVISEIGEQKFETAVLQHERDLIAGNRIENQIGVWGRYPVISDLLQEESFAHDPKQMNANDLGVTEAELKAAVASMNKRLETTEFARKGYAGWLMTNPDFIAQHDALLRTHGDRIRVNGFPVPHNSQNLHAPLEYRWPHPTLRDGQFLPETWIIPEDEWLQEYKQFCERWRLSHLSGPNLPEPWLPLLPAWKTSVPGVHLFRIPDIYPIGADGYVGQTIEDTLRGWKLAECEHLDEWFHIVGKANSPRNRIERFGRFFRLQHYWRLLHERHAGSLRQCKGLLVAAFANFFDVSEDRIKADLRLIGGQLGGEWAMRPCPLSQA